MLLKGANAVYFLEEIIDFLKKKDYSPFFSATDIPMQKSIFM